MGAEWITALQAGVSRRWRCAGRAHGGARVVPTGRPGGRHGLSQSGGAGPAAAGVLPTHENITPLILGAGTNVLPPDSGLETLVLCLQRRLMTLRAAGGTAWWRGPV